MILRSSNSPGPLEPSDYPTPWQRKTLWTAGTALSVVCIGAVFVGVIWLLSTVIGFLQPILIPFAVAGVMAYLLDPVVSRIVSWGTSRQQAVWAVFIAVTMLLAGIVLWIVPALSEQTVNLARRVPGYTRTARNMVVDSTEHLRVKYGLKLLPLLSTNPEAREGMAALGLGVDRIGPPAPPEFNALGSGSDVSDPAREFERLLTGDWVQTTLPTVLRNSWRVIRTSVGGFLGIFGFLLSMIIVPIYLYYFLIESRKISETWGDYLPLRASAFKDEVISALNEINGYLIAFFRGQLIVSLINGTATGIGLVIVGLDFGLLIGLLLCFLGLIPYLGIVLCWIPAVIIGAVQGGSWMIPAQPWWLLPLVVTGVFFLVQQVDGLFLTPKIVGESVGLHPMTVIMSVFIWSLLLGGLIGAILAVPLTATIKVLLKRYIWQRKLLADQAVITEETFAVQQAQATPTHSELVTGR